MPCPPGHQSARCILNAVVIDISPTCLLVSPDISTICIYIHNVTPLVSPPISACMTTSRQPLLFFFDLACCNLCYCSRLKPQTSCPHGQHLPTSTRQRPMRSSHLIFSPCPPTNLGVIRHNCVTSADTPSVLLPSRSSRSPVLP